MSINNARAAVRRTSKLNWSLTPIILLAAGCSVLDPYNMIGRQMGQGTRMPTDVVPAPPEKMMGVEARARAFDFVWQTINERYHDPNLNGADWKAVGAR